MTRAGQCVPLGRLQNVACDASRPVYGPPASLGRCVRSGKANIWPSDVAVRRSVKSDGQFSSSDFTEGLLSEATMTRTGLFPSPEPLSEAKRPHAARPPSPEPPSGPLSEAKRPCAARRAALSQFATTQQRVRGVRHYGNGRPSRCDPLGSPVVYFVYLAKASLYSLAQSSVKTFFTASQSPCPWA